ncbi:MAG: aldose epimerase family protein [Eubacteriales bacterium]|nr:aldose epimerase family protein [Eubacteriales bacterium]
MSIQIQKIGEDIYGHSIDQIKMTNASGASAVIMNFGATLLGVYLPDENGNLQNMCLRFDDIKNYDAPKNGYLGATVGRYGNRIKNGRFSLNGKEYQISQNEGENTLHGGKLGFNRRWWSYEYNEGKGVDAVNLHYMSHDGEEGFPGNLDVQVVYLFTDNNELQINYIASCDKDTVINLTNHSYFNLAGGGDTLSHEIKIYADRYVETTADLIPTGNLIDVSGTPYDLRNFTPLKHSLSLADSHEGFKNARGFDTSYHLNGSGYRLAAEIKCPSSKRLMQVYTDQPAVQFYSGQGLNRKAALENGRDLIPHAGLAFETQHHPDSPNQENFPTTVLKKGEVFSSTTSYKFSSF